MLEVIKLKEEITEIRSQIDEIKNDVVLNKRALTDEEEEKLCQLKREIEDKQKEIDDLEKKAAEEVPEDVKEEEKEKRDNEEEKKEEEETRSYVKTTNKNINVNKMNKLQYRFNEAVKNREYNREIEMNVRTIQVTGDNGNHDAVIQEDFTDILEPLYANSIISKLGIQTRTGCINDIHVPKMDKGTVGFLGEIEAAQATGNNFDYVTLTPKRIGAYVDISEQELLQDSLGVFQKVQANLIKKLNEYIQEKMFDNQAATSLRPAGLFYNQSPVTVADYGDICDLEASLEEADVYGDMKYAMNPKVKSFLRQTIKGTNATGMIFENNEVDGTPAEVTSSVPSKKFIYGNWSNVLFATWANPILKISDSATGLITGEVRVYLGAYIDWAVLRPEAFAFGQIE